MKLYRSTKKVALTKFPMDLSFDLNATRSRNFVFSFGVSQKAISEVGSIKDFSTQCDAILILDRSTNHLSDFASLIENDGGVIFTKVAGSFDGLRYIIEDGKVYLEVTPEQFESLSSTENVKLKGDVVYRYDERFKIKNAGSANYIGLPLSEFPLLSIYSLVDGVVSGEAHYFENFEPCPELNRERLKIAAYHEVVVSTLDDSKTYKKLVKLPFKSGGDNFLYSYIFMDNVQNSDTFFSNLTISV